MDALKLKHKKEMEVLEKDTQARYNELKSFYSKEHSQLAPISKSAELEYIEKIHSLEAQLKQPCTGNCPETKSLQEKLGAFEQKLEQKKEKISKLKGEMEQKLRECDKSRLQVDHYSR